MKRGALLAIGLAGCGLVVLGCGSGPSGGDGATTVDMTSTNNKPDLTMKPGGDMAGVDANLDGPASTDDLTMANQGDLTMVAQGDMANAPCQNTGQSCGMPGMCADCTNNAGGHACVNNVCGCNSQTDCPMGNACVN